MKRPITLSRLSKVWMGLQTARSIGTPGQRGRINAAMDLISDVQLDLRRKLIFEAGAKARVPKPKFQGEYLGSTEAMTFYDGYASKHPGFVNPYRAR